MSDIVKKVYPSGAKYIG